MSHEGQWVRAEGVLWRRTTAGVVVLGSAAEKPVTITGAGVLIWELLEEPIPPEELFETLASIHGMQTSAVSADVTPVVTELLRLGVMETCP